MTTGVLFLAECVCLLPCHACSLFKPYSDIILIQSFSCAQRIKLCVGGMQVDREMKLGVFKTMYLACVRGISVHIHRIYIIYHAATSFLADMAQLLHKFYHCNVIISKFTCTPIEIWYIFTSLRAGIMHSCTYTEVILILISTIIIEVLCISPCPGG